MLYILHFGNQSSTRIDGSFERRHCVTVAQIAETSVTLQLDSTQPSTVAVGENMYSIWQGCVQYEEDCVKCFSGFFRYRLSIRGVYISVPWFT